MIDYNLELKKEDIKSLTKNHLEEIPELHKFEENKKVQPRSETIKNMVEAVVKPIELVTEHKKLDFEKEEKEKLENYLKLYEIDFDKIKQIKIQIREELTNIFDPDTIKKYLHN